MSSINSLDPRVNRLQIPAEQPLMEPLQAEDQMGTYQVFLQPRAKKPYEHAGIVHASTLEMAFLFAKEQFSRRFTCVGMAVTATAAIQATPFTEGKDSIYNHMPELPVGEGEQEAFDIFHLKKRGKQHHHMGTLMATDYQDALRLAREQYGEQMPNINVWVIKRDDMLWSDEDFADIWDTLPDKGYRDAAAYKAGDKLKNFLAKNS